MSQPISPKVQVFDTPIMLFDGATVSKATAGAAAAILLMPNGRRYTVSQFLSKVTQQEAEYLGLIIGLQKAQKLGLRKLEVKADGEILFNQIKGLTTITDPQLLNLYKQALKLISRFDKVSFELIPPEQNRSAITAVNRCIGEALGIDAQSNTPATPAQVTPKITRMLQLGSRATEEDYQNLTAEKDDFTLKSLSQLRQLVPDEIRDEIALYWDGTDENLTEIYRWYLRGLSPNMAIRKVEIDTQGKQKNHLLEEKLPWEGILQFHSESQAEEFEAENLFQSAEGVEQKNIFETENIFKQASDVLEKEFYEKETLIFPLAEEFVKEEDLSVLEDLELILTESNEGEEDICLTPAKIEESMVMQIVNLIEALSSSEKIVLVEELVKNGDLVNLMLRALAEQMISKQR